MDIHGYCTCICTYFVMEKVHITVTRADPDDIWSNMKTGGSRQRRVGVRFNLTVICSFRVSMIVFCA